MSLGLNSRPMLSFSCPLKWDDLDGDAIQRHCGNCQKQVVNVSDYNDEQLVKLQKRRDDGEKICIAYKAPEITKPIADLVQILNTVRHKLHELALPSKSRIITLALSGLMLTGNMLTPSVVSAENVSAYKDKPYSTTPAAKSTDIALEFFVDDRVNAYAHSLQTGKPLPGVQITSPDGDVAVTDPDGWAELPFKRADKNHNILTATKGDESLRCTYEPDLAKFQTPTKWCTIFDNTFYKPGQTIKLKGWIRNTDYSNASKNNFSIAAPTISSIHYKLFKGFKDETVESSGEAPVDQFGNFDLQIKLSQNTVPDQWWLLLATSKDKLHFPPETDRNEREHFFITESMKVTAYLEL